MKTETPQPSSNRPIPKPIPAPCDHPDFPLFKNPNGQWCKKIKQKPRYFGAVSADPTGEVAWKLYNREKPFWDAGQNPREIARAMGQQQKPPLQLWEIAELWLTYREGLIHSKDSERRIDPRTFDESRYAIKFLFRYAVRGADVMGWPPGKWEKLRADLGTGVSESTKSRNVNAVIDMMEWAFRNGHIPRLPNWGKDEFARVGKDAKDLYRFNYQQEHGDRVFELETARTLLQRVDNAVAAAGLNMNNTSGFRGVHKREDGNWEAYYVKKKNGVRTKVCLGRHFKSAEEAADARNAAAEANSIHPERRMIIGRRLYCAGTYVAANTGSYCKDIALLQFQDLDKHTRYVNRTRSKTGEYWQAVLWPETMERIEQYLEVRPEPDRNHPQYSAEWEKLIFLSSTGLPINLDTAKHDAEGKYLHTNRKDIFKAHTRKILEDLGIKEKGLNFGAWRHTFESLASKAKMMTMDEFKKASDALYRTSARKIPGSRDRYVKLPYEDLKYITDTVRETFWPEKVAAERLLEEQKAENKQAGRKIGKPAMRLVS